MKFSIHEFYYLHFCSEKLLKKNRGRGPLWLLESSTWGPGLITFLKIFLRVLTTNIASDTFALKKNAEYVSYCATRIVTILAFQTLLSALKRRKNGQVWKQWENFNEILSFFQFWKIWFSVILALGRYFRLKKAFIKNFIRPDLESGLKFDSGTELSFSDVLSLKMLAFLDF